jgi:hypothetical protein
MSKKDEQLGDATRRMFEDKSDERPQEYEKGSPAQELKPAEQGEQGAILPYPIPLLYWRYRHQNAARAIVASYACYALSSLLSQ